VVKTRNAEERLAYQRIGDTTKSAARWLLNFAYRDLAGLSEGDWLNLRWEYVAFCLRGGPVGLVSRQHVQDAQRWLRIGVDHLAKGEWWPFNFEMKVRLGILKGKLVEKSHSRGSPFEMMTWRVLQAEATDVRLCAKCGRPFIANKRQTYCAPRCSQSARTQAWRVRHRGKVREARREAYKKRLEAARGGPVRIQRHT
jgi:hypothetical protein